MKQFCEAFACANTSTCLYGVECGEASICICGMRCLNCISYAACKRNGKLKMHSQNDRERRN